MGDYLTEDMVPVERGRRPADSTLAVHADDITNTVHDVAPPLHLSTTFRYPEGADPWAGTNV